MDYAKLMEEKVLLEQQNVKMRAVLSALIYQANRDPFCSVGHWVEHGPCAAILDAFSAAQMAQSDKYKIVSALVDEMPNGQS